MPEDPEDTQLSIDAALQERRSAIFFDDASKYKARRVLQKKMEEIILPNQGHTLACMIRTHLFENGASFAACTVPHPLDTSLTVRIESKGHTSKDCLLLSLRDASEEVETAVKTVKMHLAHRRAAREE